MKNEATKQNIEAFLKGFASVFDLSGRTFEFPDFSGGFERDAKALAGDWQKVGGDLRKAMNQIQNER
ncbi:MAG: hypothetical protein FWG66_09360 [Spirochaetes bacterium]|nr:hypothetical protein [Spirochaetota bacterium]